MSRRQVIEQQQKTMSVVAEISSVFEGIASMRIAQIKNQVLQATEFFNDLWQIYTQLRVDSLFRFGRSQSQIDIIDKELFIVITAEGGFSGDIDQRLIKWMLEQYDPQKNDVVVIGHHGATQLAQNGVAFKKYFKLPTQDRNINVLPIVQQVQSYAKTSVFYQEYVSLMVQDIKRIELSTAVANQGKHVKKGEEIISEVTYIFEPSTYDVIDHLERSMLQIALSQVILDSKLAQYASRFRAMTQAHERADESLDELRLLHNRAIRSVKDERLKEIVNGMRKAGVA